MHRNENSWPKPRILDVLGRKRFVIIIYFIKYYKVIVYDIHLILMTEFKKHKPIKITTHLLKEILTENILILNINILILFSSMQHNQT